MGIVSRWNEVARAIAIAVAVITVGCGSTSPVSPSPVPAPAPAPAPAPGPGPAPVPPPTQYPSVVGNLWLEDASRFTVQYLEGTTPTHYNCDTRMAVYSQTGGSFAGDVIVEGVSPDSDRYCTFSAPFTAEMAVDGTITGFKSERSFRCLSSAYQSGVRGTATSSSIRIEVIWRAVCPDPAGRSRDMEFTFALSVRRAAALLGE
jgi:hypothetical protein